MMQLVDSGSLLFMNIEASSNKLNPQGKGLADKAAPRKACSVCRFSSLPEG
jgi:hypothetical protein